MTYYHGSVVDIKEKNLEPRPSSVIGGESAVFATNNLMVATIFISGLKTKDIDFSMYGGRWFLIEMRPNAFGEYFEGKSGYLYFVAASHFHDDKRVGLRGIEFISKEPVPIMKKMVIKDLWKNVLRFKKRKELVVLTFKEYTDYLGQYKN